MEKRKLATIEDIEYFLNHLSEAPVWKKLYDKTQVFNERVEEAVKTRGSHSDDVGIIAGQLASKLTSDDVKIRKSVLLGRLHDIGHIPYGHAGESIADSIINDRHKNEHERRLTDKQKKDIATIRKCLFGESYVSKNEKPCFEHNENSVLQYYLLCDEIGYEADPEIIEGILSHSTSRYLDLPPTLAQQAVRLADKIAYINYDVNDLQLSFEGKEEWEALKTIYQRPILDAEGRPITIEYKGKQYTNVLEFIEGLTLAERISLFVDEAIRMAKEDKARNTDPKYANYETILTGGNNIVVDLSQLKKDETCYIKDTKTYTPKGEAEKRRLKNLLIAKSPILYLSYEIKERSDEYIRAGTGLTIETQQERSKNAQSPIGNEDLKNQYIYDKLVVFIENRDKINFEQIPEKLRQVFRTFFQEYEKYKAKQEAFIANLPGNTEKVQYPEIYTILNFIGLHSNTELDELSKHLGINLMFKDEVLPKIQALISDEKMYNKSKGTFTKAGLDERDKIVDEYGAHLEFHYGMEEDDMTPTTSKAVENAARQYGYREKEDEERTIEQAKEIPEELQVAAFHEQISTTDAATLQAIQNRIMYNQEEVQKGYGR